MKKYLLVFAGLAVVLSVFSAIPARAAGVCPNYFATQISVGDKDGEDGRARGGADLRGLTAVAEMQQFLKTQGVATAIPNRELGNFGNGSTLSALNVWQDKLTVNSAESLAGTPVGQRYWGPKSIIVANRLKCGTTDALPPLVAFSYPTTAATYATTAVQTILAVTARDNVGVASLSWTSNRKNNGLMQGVTTNYPANTGAGLGLSQIWNGPNEIVHLLPGLNTITVTATDAASNHRAAVLNITRNTGATPVNGVCGSANGVAVASAPIANLCSAGTPTAVSFSSFGNYWWWKCRGTGMNSLTPTCRARKLPSTDRIQPTINITHPTTAEIVHTPASQVALAGTASDNVGVTAVTWTNNRGGSGTAVGTSLWSTSLIELANGNNRITVTARDVAGNQKSDLITVQRTPNRTSPTIEITYPTTNGSYATNSPTLILKGTATSPIGLTAVKWYNERNASVEQLAVGTANWSATIPLQAGTNVIRVRAIDTAGRDSYDNITVNYATDDTNCFILDRNLFLNDGVVGGHDQKSQDVFALQTYLIVRGFLATKYQEGNFGPATLEALTAWQKTRGLNGKALTEKDSRNRSYWGPLSQAEARKNCSPVCVSEGQSLGAVVPSNTKICCAGLVQQAPADGIVGSRGICVRPVTGSEARITSVTVTPSSDGFKRGASAVVRFTVQNVPRVVITWSKLGPTGAVEKTGWVTKAELTGKQGHDESAGVTGGGLTWLIPPEAVDGNYIIQVFKFKNTGENYNDANDTGARTPVMTSAQFAISGAVSATPAQIGIEPLSTNQPGNTMVYGSNITAYAPIGNSGGTAATNVRLDWYYDGRLLKSPVIALLPAGSGFINRPETTVVLPKPAVGTHRLKMYVTYAGVRQQTELSFTVTAPVSVNDLNLMGNILQALREILGGLR